MKWFSLYSYTFAVFATATNALADVSPWKEVGGWDISFYPNQLGCLALAVYEKGTYFWIGFDRRQNDLLLEITISDPAWKSIEDGKEYKINVFFGDETPWTLEMNGMLLGDLPSLSFSFDTSTEQADLFADEFQRETGMKWFYGNTQLGTYTLRGSRAAFEEVIACQKSFNAAYEQVDDPFSGSSQRKKSDPFE